MSEFVGLYLGDHWGAKQTSAVAKSLDELTTLNTNYDVFVYWDTNRKIVDLEFLAWLNDSTRTNELIRQDGVYVKYNDPTRRYAGTVRTVAAGVIADASSRRFVWNFYNRVPLYMSRVEGTSFWSYNSTTFHQTNSQTANKFEYVSGDVVGLEAEAISSSQPAATGAAMVAGIGVDTTNENQAQIFGAVSSAVNGVGTYVSRAIYKKSVIAGYHAVNWLEAATAGTITAFGTAGAPTLFQTGMIGVIMG